MSGSEFDALPYEEGRRWELLEGRLIEAPSPTPLHQDVVGNALVALDRYLNGSSGEVFMGVEFALSSLLRLRPDVCLLLPEKVSALDWDHAPVPGAPDLAVDVISPTDLTGDCHDRVAAYLRNGTTEVWQIFQKSHTIDIHCGKGSRTLDASQTLTSDLLPGFEAAVQTFFE